VKFFIDRCAGRRLAQWLRERGHDVREARDLTPDPGDAALLALAAGEQRVLVTIDTDFATLVYLGGAAHAGIIRLPDLRTPARIALMAELLARHSEADLAGAIVTVTGNRMRFARPPQP
jgi:predicted nuclease of predicted toxin-antitoxin system